MILVDTSIWIDHLRLAGAALTKLLEANRVLGQAWVTGELTLCSLGPGSPVISLLGGLPPALVASNGETLHLFETATLGGSGFGYVDAQLLAATRLTPDATLWT